MGTHAPAKVALGLVAWTVAAGLPAWGQGQPVPPAPVPQASTAEIERFYIGVDEETKAFLRRGAAGVRLVPEGAVEQAPAVELAAQRARWLALIEGDRYEAIENLGAARCVEAVPALLRLATDREVGDLRARWLAVRALGRIGDQRAIPELIYLVNYFDENTRTWARASLYRLTGQWFGGDRDAWGRWWNDQGGEPRYVPEERYPGPAMLVLTQPTTVGGGGAGQITANGKRAWGPEQAAGEPDTFQAGDIVTAWASLTPDASPEWLQLVYEKAVVVAGVNVRETYCPGAVCKVTAVADDGQETTLWEGQDPTREAPGVFAVPVQGEATARRIKVYLDSPGVPGWNEIDAVELVGRDGSRQWAAEATASSTYAEQMVQRRVRSETVPRLPPSTQVPAHVAFHREGAFYWNDFEDPATAGKGWSRQDTFPLPVTPPGDGFGGGKALGGPRPTTLLGRFGNAPVSLTLESVPSHRFVQVTFEFYALSSWDGDRPGTGPDLWLARVEDGPRLVYASFAPPHSDSPTQSFPLPFGLGGMAPGSAGRRVSAPIPFNDGRSPSWTQHYVYPMCFTVPHSGPVLRVWFTGIGLEPVDNESWALDNVGVALLDELPRRELTQAQLDDAWRDLGAGDAVTAYRAMQALVAAGDATVPFLMDRLAWQSGEAVQARLGELTRAFEHDDHGQWEEAAAELQGAGPRLFARVFAGLDRRRFGPNPPSWLSELFDAWSPPPDAELDVRREARAAWVLEWLWTDAARRALLIE